MKKCPYCLAELHDAAFVCSYCNSDLMVTVPMSIVSEQKTLERARKKRKFVAFVIAGLSITFSVLIIIAMLALLWNFY